MSDWLESELACPRDRLPVERSGSSLVCPRGHSYPVVHGIPVMLTDDPDETLWVAGASLAAARHALEHGSDGVHVETLGLSEEDRRELARESFAGARVDPVVRYMIVATCGQLYRALRRTLSEYPIPEIRLPEGRGRRLLDIGCNWGRWSFAAARRGYDVVGIDPSLGGVLAAARVADQLGLKARFVVADARRLPFLDDTFDVTFSYSVLQHLSKANVAVTLDEVRRTLRPGGESLIQMANRYGIRTTYNQWRRGFTEGEGFEVRFWGPRELKAGFEEHIGESRLSVDGFLGLGIQKSDLHMMPAKHRWVIRCSETLRAMSRGVPPLKYVADSLYVHSVAPRSSGATGTGTPAEPERRQLERESV